MTSITTKDLNAWASALDAITDTAAIAALGDCLARAQRAADSLSAAYAQLHGSVDGERDRLWSACDHLDEIAWALNDVTAAFRTHRRGGGR